MPPRTRKMTRTEVRTRAQHAHAFLTAADLVVDLGHDAGIDDLGNTIGSLAVLAGIAAGDAICGAVLGERAPARITATQSRCCAAPNPANGSHSTSRG
jgi:hypothetical protein